MTIDRTLWQRARPLFNEIVELDVDARRARLEAIGRGEPAMRDTLERLLQADGVADEALRGFDFAPGPPSIPTPPVDLDPLGIVGHTVSHFNVTDFIAAGGMGVVYKAADATLGRVVAIKFPLPHQRMDDDAKERFIHEARSIAALDHPNLCTVYEFGESAHGLYLAMPFYQGETLKDRIARERVLATRDAVGIARQVAAGLASAHAAGIVHRDLKPGNVMILPDGSVKILDFGIAKVRDVQLTRTGVALGTIAYMSPSQATGERANAQADLWATGVMLYEMLTGTLPFPGSNEMAILHAVLNVDPVPPSRVNRDVPPALDTVVLGLLQKDPSRRYSSATFLITDLDAAIAREPIAHTAPVAKRFAGPSIRRIALPAAAMFAVAAAAWYGRQMLHASSASPSATERSVAVLPFVDPEGNDATAFIAPGFAEEVSTLLGRVSGLKVGSQSSAGEFRRQQLAPADIAKRLGVVHLVDATARIASDTFYLSARLTHTPDSIVVWRGDFKAPLARLVSLERQVADSLLRALESGSRLISSASGPTTDPATYLLFLKGRSAWRTRTPETLDGALAYYQEVLTRDQKFAPAYSGIAEVYVNMSNFGWGNISTHEALAHAEKAAHQAVALDPSLAEAHSSLAMVQMSRGRYAEAEASLQRSMRQDPNWSSAHHLRALLFEMLGRSADSRTETRITLAMDPLSRPSTSHLGVILLGENKVDSASEQLRQALEFAPEFPVTLQYLGVLDAYLGKYSEAETLLRKALAKSAAYPGVAGALAYTYTKTGRNAEARRIMADASAAATDERSRLNYALSLAIVGQLDSAFAMLNKPEWDIPTLIEARVDPLLRAFRSDPRYPKILAEAGLKP